MDNNKILLAVPTDNGISIFEKMLGMAKYFYIYRIDKKNNEFEFVETRLNIYRKTQQHLKTLDVYSLINDCRLILAKHIGKKGIERLKERDVELFFDKGNIEQALNNMEFYKEN